MTNHSAPMRMLMKPAGGAGGRPWAPPSPVSRMSASTDLRLNLRLEPGENSGVPSTGTEDDEAAEEAGRAGGNLAGCRFTSGGGTAGAFFTGGAAILA